LYLLPALVVLLTFHFIPIFYALRVSMFRWGIAGAERFIGFRNYGLILQDFRFWQSLKNTLWYSMGTVPLTMAISLAVALMLNALPKGRNVYLAMYFLPMITSIVAISVVWRWIYHPRFGLANAILSILPVPRLGWLNEWRSVFPGGPSLALVSIIVLMVWKTLGYDVVIFLAGLQTIPREYYEAAIIDGATGWVKFWRITFPLLSPTTFYLLIISTILSFQIFAPVWLITGPPPGGPLGTTNVLVYYIYENAFNFSRYGYASTLSIILFVILISMTILQRRVIESRVYYEV